MSSLVNFECLHMFYNISVISFSHQTYPETQLMFIFNIYSALLCSPSFHLTYQLSQLQHLPCNQLGQNPEGPIHLSSFGASQLLSSGVHRLCSRRSSQWISVWLFNKKMKIFITSGVCCFSNFYIYSHWHWRSGVVCENSSGRQLVLEKPIVLSFNFFLVLVHDNINVLSVLSSSERLNVNQAGALSSK